MDVPAAPAEQPLPGLTNEARIREALPQRQRSRTAESPPRKRPSDPGPLDEGDRAFRLGLDVIGHQARRAAIHLLAAGVLGLPLVLVSDPGPAEYAVAAAVLFSCLLQVFEINRRLGQYDRAVRAETFRIAPTEAFEADKGRSRARIEWRLRVAILVPREKLIEKPKDRVEPATTS